jgi:GAF domain-containing protein
MSMEAKRLEALDSYRILDTAPHPSFDSVTRAAQTAFDAPIALISLLDSYRQWFKSRIGLDLRETPRHYSFCAHAVGLQDVFAVEDAHSDSRFRDNPLVVEEPHIRFYAGAPIIDSEGFALGTLCVIDHKARQFDARERRLLGEFAECAMTAITLHSQSLLLLRADRLIKRYAGRELMT